MRVNVALFAAGELLTLAGVAMWSVPLALILAGVQCLAIGLLRADTARAAAAKPRKPTVQRHRRGRNALRLVPPLVRRAS